MRLGFARSRNEKAQRCPHMAKRLDHKVDPLPSMQSARKEQVVAVRARREAGESQCRMQHFGFACIEPLESLAYFMADCKNLPHARRIEAGRVEIEHHPTLT